MSLFSESVPLFEAFRLSTYSEDADRQIFKAAISDCLGFVMVLCVFKNGNLSSIPKPGLL
jgi:hypothetical protein